MKQRIAILTDSSSSIYRINHQYDNIFMIDLPCYIGDNIFTDFEKNKDDLFYEALSKTNLIAKTSQPSVGETVAKFEYIKSLGFTDIIYIPISKELSGTYQNGYISKDLVEGINIEIIDSRTTASILTGMTLEAAKMANEGKSVEAIVERIYHIRDNSRYFVAVNDLTALVKNGRLSNAKSIIANILKIKPVIELTNDGKLVSLENVRTFKNAIKRLVEHVERCIDKVKGEIHVSHTNNQETLDYLLELLKEKFPTTKILTFTVPSTIVAHIGLAAIAIGYINF